MYKRGNTMVNGYLHTEGRFIKNEGGDVVILRGWAMGSWMLPEGYMVSGVGGMFGFTGMEDKLIYNIRYDRGRTMHDMIKETCGSAYAKNFWPRWYRNMLQEEDIKKLAALGYNSVRLPLDASGLLDEEPGYHFNEDSFLMLDQVIDWCEKYRIYAILDLHGAPGGQSGVSCDNGLDNVPHLFQEPESWERTIVLWEYIAKRYQDRWIVGGYELLNEPISTPQWHYLRLQLRRFYDETIARIRQIDKKHTIFLQCSSFAHDTETFDKEIDPECRNWVMVFHEHHIKPELKSISKWLEASMRLDVPAWFGEGSGEQEELAYILDMLEDLGIGYNHFSWKAMDERTHKGNEVHIFPMPEKWGQMIAYIAERGPRPSYQESQEIFDELLECCKLERCEERRPDLHKYMLKKPGITIPSVGYDSKFKNKGAFSSNWPYSNPFNYRSEDETKLVVKPGGQMPGLFDNPECGPKATEELWLELSEGEYADYTIYDITMPCSVKVAAFPIDETIIEVSYENKKTHQTVKTEIKMKGADKQQTCDAIVLPVGEEYTVRLDVREGRVQIVSVSF